MSGVAGGGSGADIRSGSGLRSGSAAPSAAGLPPAGLHCAVVVTRGEFSLAAEIAAAPGEIVGIIGPNGSGKSTLLGAIAGTMPLTAGEVLLDGRVLSRAGAGAGTSAGADPERKAGGSKPVTVPRFDRHIGYLDQRARLFPHLDAATNIAFGLRAQRVSKTESARAASEWLERVGLAGRERARESQLSGGQQQRVAIARTLAAGPRAILLDEPFAALDVASAQELRALVATEVRRLGVPAVLVTHDPVDLIALADRVIVLERGRVAQRGTVAEVLAAPTTEFAAEFSGRVLLRGVAAGVARAAAGSDAAGPASGVATVRLDGAPVPELPGTVSGPALVAGEPVAASFDPAAVLIAPAGVGYPAPGDAVSASVSGAGIRWTGIRWTGTVATHAASRTGVRIECAEWPGFWAEVPVSRALDAGLAPGSRVTIELSAAAIMLSGL